MPGLNLDDMLLAFDLSDVSVSVGGPRVSPHRPPRAARATRSAKLRRPERDVVRLTDDEVTLVKQLRACGLSWTEIQAKFDDRPKPPSLKTLRDILDAGIPYHSVCFKDASGTSNPRKVHETFRQARKLLGVAVQGAPAGEAASLHGRSLSSAGDFTPMPSW